MSATYHLTHAYPDCPTCGSVVDGVEHESIDRERYFDTDHAIHVKGNPYVLRPCGHQMWGCLLQDLGVADARITEWLESTADIGAKMHHPARRRTS